MSHQKRKVLFLCTGNSCRSQMAEAIVNARLGEQWEAFSAGTKPAGYVHPAAIQALAEIGIQHQGESKPAERFRKVAFDLVVTVCDDAAENCPLWLGQGRRVHHGFQDPAKATGSEKDVMQVFRRVRDQIAEEIPLLLEMYADQPEMPGFSLP
ncbi:MAG TPA: arsenate reductase ArsC [Chloroflexi bacterium]|nr:arsenate reductase ArsC [Chloroflexota bacterium]